MDAPRVDPRLLSDPRDLQTLLIGLRKCLEIGEAPALKQHSPNGVVFPSRPHSDEKLVDHIRKSLETLYHPVGTCKMGNDGMAVVDHQLRVHGLRNLRVVDASIMPTIVSGNTNAATIMIAEKAAALMYSSSDVLM
jgi:choline dehydrogenase